MKAIGCYIPDEDDGSTLCNECSMAYNPDGNDSQECKDFRKEHKYKLIY